MKKYEECFEHLIVLNEILPEDETKKDLEALLQIITEEVNDNNPVDSNIFLIIFRSIHICL